MCASIQSLSFPAFYCRVYSEPALEKDDFVVYKIVSRDATIKKLVHGVHVSTFDHIAIDKIGNVHLFDMSKQVCAGSGGPCVFIPDGP